MPNEEGDSLCSRCGWDGQDEIDEGYEVWSRSTHVDKEGKIVCSHCLKPEDKGKELMDWKDKCLKELGWAWIYIRWLEPDFRESDSGKEQYRRVKLLAKEFAVSNHRQDDDPWWESFHKQIVEETENLC